jgi:hypothetical protein
MHLAGEAAVAKLVQTKVRAGAKKTVQIGKWRPTKQPVPPIAPLTTQMEFEIENVLALQPTQMPFPRALRQTRKSHER